MTMPKLLLQCLVVGAAGFLGATCRFLVGMGCQRAFGTAFPSGTLVVNITGSLFLGWFVTVVGDRAISDSVRLAVAVGFVGAYTTFSSLMYESAALYEEGSQIKALLNLFGSLALGMLAVYVGIVFARRF